MTIEEADFRLTPCSEASSQFDLELLYVVNKGKNNERTEFRNAGYGLSLESAIRKITMSRIGNKYGEGTISLKQFLEEFKGEIEKIKQMCGI